VKHFARRLADIQPFRVMEVFARAQALEAKGRSIIHMEIGEPDFPTAEPIVEAGVRALRAGRTQYAPALGLPELRAAIAASYPRADQPQTARVIVTPGASGALQLVFAALINPGDQVLMADPGYPCNRHFVRLFEGEALGIPVTAETRYQLTAELIRRHWTPKTVAVLAASPSNPSGTALANEELKRIVETVDALGGVLIVDEIYHGLTYDVDLHSVLAYSERAFVINSFSKFFGMTGWRIGWLVVPEPYLDDVAKLAQNVFIATSTPAQYAALAALEPALRPELERRRRLFQERRDYIFPAVRALGFEVPVLPEGAFYIYADSSRFAADSQALVLDLLEHAGVAITPGCDFGEHLAGHYVRFTYANTLEHLKTGIERMAHYLAERARATQRPQRRV
jgi:aspartate/methionine/tyrosine aminotransferase